MTFTLAFDVYGTLIDPLDVSRKLGDYVGEHAAAFARTWRDKQIEYLFRRALMGDYRNFSTCTRQALEYTDQSMQTHLHDAVKDALMEKYRVLPAYAGVTEALQQLRSKECRMYAFSNGQPDDLEHLLETARLTEYLDDIISVDKVQSYKPDPAVYRHFLASTDSMPENTWLVSGNPFDVIGAIGAGWNAAWLKRNRMAVFDPWGVEPTATITDLAELTDIVQAGNRSRIRSYAATDAVDRGVEE
jgi:2-haloacid dehalogenase